MYVDFVQQNPQRPYDDDFQRDNWMNGDCNVAGVHGEMHECFVDCNSNDHCLIGAAYRAADGGVCTRRLRSCCPPPLFSPTTFPH